MPDKEPAKSSGGLSYVGDGAALPDVPPRDLSADELADILNHLVVLATMSAPPNAKPPTIAQAKSALIASGLYKES